MAKKAADIRAQLRRAIERHLRENSGGAMVVNPEGLIERIVEEIGAAAETKRRAPTTEFVHAGYLCRRTIGSEMGRRGNARNKYGWIIFDAGSGREVDRISPIAESGVSEAQARRRAEQLRQLADRDVTAEAAS